MKTLAFGRTKELVHVDMNAKMLKMGLVNLFPIVCWLDAKAVVEVATKLEKWKKQGVPVHFVCVELHKYAIMFAFVLASVGGWRRQCACQVVAHTLL